MLKGKSMCINEILLIKDCFSIDTNFFSLSLIGKEKEMGNGFSSLACLVPMKV